MGPKIGESLNLTSSSAAAAVGAVLKKEKDKSTEQKAD
jgi:hypothetical protein